MILDLSCSDSLPSEIRAKEAPDLMNTMDLDIRPRGPVVPSQLSAHHLIEKWVRENDFSSLKDGDGIAWDLELVGKEIPDPDNPYGLIWEISVVLKADIAIDELLATGVLDKQKDARMLDLLGAKKIPFVMKPRVLIGKSDEEVRKLVIDALPILRRDLGQVKLQEIKRKLLGRWLDASRAF
jgi:hypothetical protein